MGWSNVDTAEFEKTLTLAACHHQVSNARTKLKDALSKAASYGTAYQLEIAMARVHKRHQSLKKQSWSRRLRVMTLFKSN
jgi:hypothetical protein